MALVAYAEKDAKVGILCGATTIMGQAVWGTAGLYSLNATEIYTDKIPIITDGVNIKRSNANHGQRFLHDNDIMPDEYGIVSKFTIEGYCHNLLLSTLLYGCTQRVIEATAKKTFTWPLIALEPDFTANAGLFFSTLISRPRVASCRIIGDCIVQSLKLTCEPGDYLKYSAAVIGRKAVNWAATIPTGTWARLDPKDNLYHYTKQVRHSININSGGATTPTLTGPWELNLENTIEAIGQDGVGNVQSFAIVGRKGTFKARILDATIASTAMTSFIAGTSSAINIGWGNATAGTDNKDLDFTFNAKFTNVPDNYDKFVNSELEMELTGITTAGVQATVPLTIITNDGVTRSWPTS